MTAPRRYFQKSIEDLEAIFGSNLNDRGILARLSSELKHRKSIRAQQLKDRTEERLQELDHQAEPGISPGTGAKAHEGEPRPKDSSQARHPRDEVAAGGCRRIDREADEGNQANQSRPNADGAGDDEPPDDRRQPETLTRIARPGVAGKPNAYVPRLKSDLTIDLPAGTTRARRYVQALAALISEMRKAGKGNQRYALENGKLIDAQNGQPIYAFPFPDRADLFEDTSVEIEADGRRRSGQLVSLAGGKLLIALDEHLGPVIHRCVLLIDNTALIEMLKERLYLADQGKIDVSLALANSVVDQHVEPPLAQPVPVVGVEGLNPDQRRSLETMLKRAVSYLWGPPGTGKTQTLSAAVKTLFEAEKRILICSNTNQAVDQLILKLCQRLGEDDPALREGKVIRVGRINLDILENYEKCITVDGITDRLSRDLKDREAEIEEQVARLDKAGRSVRRDLDLFASVGKIYDEVSSLRQQLQKRQSDRQQASAAMDQARKRAEQWQREHEDLSSAGPLRRVFMRSAEKIIADIHRAEADAQRLAQAARDAQAEVRALEADVAERDLVARELARALDGKEQSELKKTLSAMEAEREPLISELQEIARKLADIAASALRDARILGMTMTRASMSARDIGRFDTVIIDEASMVMLPALYLVAGLATERVIVSGDFRQLPPIVESEQQSIHDLIGMDVFAAAGIDRAGDDDRRCLMLGEQYRMSDGICQLIARPMYGGKLRTSEARRPAEQMVRPPAPYDQALTIVDTSALWPFESRNAFGSRYNLLHVLLVRNLVHHLAQHRFLDQEKPLGICSPYSAQAKLLLTLLKSERSHENVPVGTVHRFQGDERRMMILDIPESIGPAKGIGLFVQGLHPDQIGARLINVAVSRAQEHLVVFANLTHLDKRLPSTAFLRSVLYEMQTHGAVIDANEVLKLRPIEHDIKDLLGIVELDLDEKRLGLFHSRSFAAACLHDMSQAKESIVILSGFVTLRRVSTYADLFRAKIAEGVKIRCVTRPPQLNGSVPPEVGRQALNALEAIGAVVDCRKQIHEKIVLIDNRVVWSGSLNPLSHTSRTDEFMTRALNPDYAEKVAAFISKRTGARAAEAGSAATEAENPRCFSCGSRTFYADGPYGPYLSCEDQTGCRWKASVSFMSADAAHPKDGGPCPLCCRPTTLRHGTWGMFYGCTGFPGCHGKLSCGSSDKSTGRTRQASGSGSRRGSSRTKRRDRQREATG